MQIRSLRFKDEQFGVFFDWLFCWHWCTDHRRCLVIEWAQIKIHDTNLSIVYEYCKWVDIRFELLFGIYEETGIHFELVSERSLFLENVLGSTIDTICATRPFNLSYRAIAWLNSFDCVNRQLYLAFHFFKLYHYF